jgi:hypothetical protein
VYRTAELMPAENHRAEGTGENEWFTPAQYIEAARAVMGEIDLSARCCSVAANSAARSSCRRCAPSLRPECD